jgi:hypothetical protein
MANKTKYGKFGAYLSPVVVIGAFIPCELRGVVRIVGMSAGPIAWPIGEKNGQDALVIYKGLSRALNLETAEDVAAWWGIDEQAVQRWQSGQREPLSAKPADVNSPGSQEEPQELRRAWQFADDDDQRQTAKATAAEPWRKKWFPPVVDGHSHASFTRKRRWEPWEDDLVRTCPVLEVVRRTQRKKAAVWARRYRLGVTSARDGLPPQPATPVVVAAPPAESPGRVKRLRASRV